MEVSLVSTRGHGNAPIVFEMLAFWIWHVSLFSNPLMNLTRWKSPIAFPTARAFVITFYVFELYYFENSLRKFDLENQFIFIYLNCIFLKTRWESLIENQVIFIYLNCIVLKIRWNFVKKFDLRIRFYLNCISLKIRWESLIQRIRSEVSANNGTLSRKLVSVASSPPKTANNITPKRKLRIEEAPFRE